MRNPLAYVLGSFFLVLAIAIAEHHPFLAPWAQELLPELEKLAYITFTVGVVWMLAEHHLEGIEHKLQEKLEPFPDKLSNNLRAGIEHGLNSTQKALDGGLGSTNATLAAGLGSINTTIDGGLQRVADALAKAVSDFPKDIWKAFSSSQLFTGIINSIPNPEMQRLAKEGRVQEAIEQLPQTKTPDLEQLSEKISLLVLSRDESNWREAVALLEKYPPAQKPNFYLSLAFRFWTVGKLEEAITLAERGMTLPGNDALALSKFRNSLAYYYGEAGRTDEREVAFQYAQEALNERPNDPGPMDTMGFLKIVFGETEEEIIEGVELCTQAWKAGGPLELYAKHIQKAATRLEQIRRTNPRKDESR